ncbi:MAG: hypothetical protein PUD10_10435 [Lachnospira sp.]|nr:hypothetical protein [Lachnospira sp.]
MNNIKLNIGLSLVLTGVPYGMYLNWLYPSWPWSPVFMIISIILLFDFKSINRWSMPRILKVIIFFQLLMITYGVFSGNEGMSSKYLSFHLYIISLCFCLKTCIGKDYDNFSHVLFFCSIPLSILGAVLMQLGMVVGETAWMLKQEDEDYSIEPFTVATGVLINLFSALVMEKKNRYYKILFFILLIIDLYVLFGTTKRTPVFVAIMGTFLYLYKTHAFTLNRNAIMGNILLCFFVLFIVYLQIPAVQEMVDGFFDNFTKGVLVLFGDTSVSDATGSAEARVRSREFAFQYIDNNFALEDYIIGAGYMTRWLDAPLLQSYLDMGIFGFFLYLYIVIIYPLNTIRIKEPDKALLIAIMVSLYPILSCLNSGNPYQYIKYTAVCLIAYFSVSNYRFKRTEK